jgi:tRNA(Glu) U13 pseudouridine synthase TruD
VRPEEVDHALAGDALRLRFRLPAGSFATVFVETLLGTPAGSAAHDTGVERAVC